MSNDPHDEKKIIIDEDWKTQVEAEREQLKQKEESGEADAPGSDQAQSGELPPASLTFLVTSIATQAMSALGQIPDPMHGKPVVHLEYAQLQIDTLAILQEKTQGNLTEEESKLIEDALHQLRMLFIAIRDQVAQMAAQEVPKDIRAE